MRLLVNRFLSGDKAERWIPVFIRQIEEWARSVVTQESFIIPLRSADGEAPQNVIYFSTDQMKLVYKDDGNVIHPLY